MNRTRVQEGVMANYDIACRKELETVKAGKGS